MRLRDENKERLIREEALKMIVSKGFDGLSMQKLAKAAGVSPATIYIYFKDREDLIEKIAIEEVDKMTQATLKNFNPEMPFEKGLSIQWQNRTKYWMQNPVAARFMEQVRFSPIGYMVQKKVKQDFSSIMRAFVQNAIKNKELIQLPVEVFWSVAYAPLYQLIKFHLDGKGMGQKPFKLDKKTMDQALKLVIKSLKP